MDLSKKAKIKPRRLLSLDTLRGFAILYMSLAHPLLFRVFEQNREQIQSIWDNTPLIVLILAFPLIMVMIWGALFTFLSGVSISYSLNIQAQDNIEQIHLRFKSIIIRSLLLWIIQYVFMFLLSNPVSGITPEVTDSLITGGLESGVFDIPSIYHFIIAPTIAKKHNKKNVYGWFLGLGIGIFVVSYILFALVGDQHTFIENLGANGNHFSQMLFVRLIGGRFSFFPIVAYGFFGAVIGAAIANGESYKKIATFGIGASLVLLMIFIVSILLGFDFIEDLSGEHQPWNIYCFNLGGQMLVYTILLKIDYVSPEKTKGHAKRSKIIRSYGKMTLTIYFFECLISILIYKVFYWLYGGIFYDSPLKIVSYIFTIFLIWYTITKFWGKKKFKYSIEYWIHEIEKRISSNCPKPIKWKTPSQLVSREIKLF
ncbi:MAG: hypothetical protein ACTSPA_00955 [Promethearchaeota archaeon]